MCRSAAIPDRANRRASPARTKAAAIVAAAVKAGPAEIVPVAIIPVITRDGVNIPGASVATRHTQRRSFLRIERDAVAQRLLVAGEETVATPVRRWPFMNGRSRRGDRQQRQDNSNCQTDEARHKRSIDSPL